MPNQPQRQPKPPHRLDQIQALAQKLAQLQNKPVDNTATIRDTQTVQLLIDNIANLEHPHGWIKHPYFNTFNTPNSAHILELKTKFCEAIVLLLQKHDRLKCTTQPKPRPKSPKSSSTNSSSDSSKKPASNTKPPAPKTTQQSA